MGGLGGVAGRLYAWNTLGSLLGALLGGYALLFFLDLHHVFAIALAALAVAAAAQRAACCGFRRSRPALLASLALGACLLLPAWDPVA